MEPIEPEGNVPPTAVEPTGQHGNAGTTVTQSHGDDELEEGEIDWIEKCGIENLKIRVATADTLAKEAAATLTVLLAGAGGAGAYAVKLLEGDRAVSTIALAAASAWLAGLACCLVYGCLRVAPIPAVYNQPGALLKRRESKQTYAEWRRGELVNIEGRIKRVVARNAKVGKWLNWIRILATATPFVSTAFAVVFPYPSKTAFIALIQGLAIA